MKAVVMEIKKNKAAVLTENYGIKTVKNRGYKVGERVEIGRRETFRNFSYKKFAAMVAAMVILVVGAFFTHTAYRANYIESYTVQVDINPSIKFSVASSGRVLKTDGLNDDAKGLDIAKLKGKNIYDALEDYIVICIDAEFVVDGVTVVIIVDPVAKGVDAAEIVDKSKTRVEQKLNDVGITSRVTAQRSNKTESYTVQIDINSEHTKIIKTCPSVKFTINNLEQVIQIEALNEEATTLDLSKLKNKNIYEALEYYIAICIDAEFVVDGVTVVIIVDPVADGIDVDKIINESKTHIEQKLNTEGIKGQVAARKKSAKDKT